ncbi:hypothetical protein BD289DRAFT_456324 [Coniella lustricola]|uniref:Uncharacterized protein n=1 Tax=Coniella lustricola TaxID=2025994 RepID=A0A2T2ZW87_9PEZI|nr:hypothetical protein BD289DRAFT_456324 [Coniella lustricola]
MSVAATLGSQGLLQLGISVSDIAYVYAQGRQWGNWFRAKKNDEELFDLLNEDPESLFRRKGVVDTSQISRKFPGIKFIYHDGKCSTAGKTFGSSGNMRSAPSAAVTDVLVSAFTNVLNDPEAESKLRVGLQININSYRDFGQVRGVVARAKKSYLDTYNDKTNSGPAIVGLNKNEEIEVKHFLQVLLEGEEHLFLCHSASTFAFAKALEQCGIDIKVSADRNHDGQLLVEYVPDSQADISYISRQQPYIQTHQRLQNNAQQISYPREEPESMIQAVGTNFGRRNVMEALWKKGAEAAAEYTLVAAADLPYTTQSPSYHYKLCAVPKSLKRHRDDGHKAGTRVTTSATFLARKYFPCQSDKVQSAVAFLIQEASQSDIDWLDTHSSTEFLLRNESTNLFTSRKEPKFLLWLSFQALVFGFYYRLLESVVTLQYIDDGDAYFRGLWGEVSTTFLAMCTCFGQELNNEGKVSRAHVLYLLASMYNGRPKIYNKGNAQKSLLGVMGKVSVVAMPLIHASDVPKEISSFAVLDLPIPHLIPDADGEIYASPTYSIDSSVVITPPQQITAYVEQQPHQEVQGKGTQANENGASGSLIAATTGFEIKDKDWTKAHIPIPRTTLDQPNAFGLVQSVGCPALRFAAAGFYAALGEEVVIANGDFEAAFGRVEPQERCIIIA